MKDKSEIDLFVGNRIKYMRKMRGYTQQVLADYIGLERVSLSNIECGRQSCSPVNMYNICCALDVGFAVMFPNREKVDVEIIEIVRRFKISKSFIK